MKNEVFKENGPQRPAGGTVRARFIGAPWFGVLCQGHTLQDTIITVFHAISGGDWMEAALPLSGFSDYTVYMFAFYVFFMTFGT